MAESIKASQFQPAHYEILISWWFHLTGTKSWLPVSIRTGLMKQFLQQHLFFSWKKPHFIVILFAKLLSSNWFWTQPAKLRWKSSNWRNDVNIFRAQKRQLRLEILHFNILFTSVFLWSYDKTSGKTRYDHLPAAEVPKLAWWNSMVDVKGLISGLTASRRKNLILRWKALIMSVEMMRKFGNGSPWVDEKKILSCRQWNKMSLDETIQGNRIHLVLLLFKWVHHSPSLRANLDLDIRLPLGPLKSLVTGIFALFNWRLKCRNFHWWSFQT